MDPTAGVLWAACHPTPSADAVTAAISAGADMAKATQIAIAQRVSPMLSRAVKGHADGPWAAALHADAARCRAQGHLVLPRLGELALQPLADADLSALVMKGAALVDRYPAVGLRAMDDVDILMPPDEVDRGVAVLMSHGWIRRPTGQRVTHEIAMTHPSMPGMPLDVHRVLERPGTATNRLTGNQLLRARVPVELFGAKAYGLPPELELVMLAAHAAKPFHSFGRMIWAVDIATVVANAQMNWEQVARLADVARCPTAVAVALGQARWLGVDSPEELRRIRGDRSHPEALELVMSHDWPVIERTSTTRYRLRFALVDDTRAKVNVVAAYLRGDDDGAGALQRAAKATTRFAARQLQRRRASQGSK